MQRLWNSVAGKLTIWFLLLSFLPIGVMAVFIRRTVKDIFVELVADETRSRTRILAAGVSLLDHESDVQALVATSSDQNYVASVIDENGVYLAHSDAARVSGSISDDFSTEIVEQLLSGGEGVTIEAETERLIGYSAVPAGETIAVIAVDGSEVATPIAEIEGSSFIQLAVSLAIVSIAGGVAIWIVIGPIQQLTRAAEEIGAGNLDVEVDSSEMEGEMEILAIAFNQMAQQLRELVGGLEQHVADRTAQLVAVNEIAQVINAELDPSVLLKEAVNLVHSRFDFHQVSIFLLDSEMAVIAASAGSAAADLLAKQYSLPVGPESMVGYVASQNRPRVASNVDTEPIHLNHPLLPDTCSEAVLPIAIGDRVLGVLDVQSAVETAFDESNVRTLQSIANHIATTLDNARLYTSLQQELAERKRVEVALAQQAAEAAVAAERSRLARDLHDAVTQTLFSASLIAEVLPRLWERDPDIGRSRLEEVRQLTRGALAEMRTLLLELRPSALVEAELGDLLRQLAEAITGRAQVPVAVEVEGERSLPPDVKVALYRIAQEALNNVAKHAGASQATVSLRCPPFPPDFGGEQRGGVELCISDDGRGFDVGSIPPDHLGVGIMHERAEAIGAVLRIDSEANRGTQVAVVWSDTQRKEPL